MMNELTLAHPNVLYVLLGIFSLCIGSFLNVLIYRLPLMLEAEWRVECRELLNLPAEHEEKITLSFPRSFCPNCKQTVKSWQNIPLLSYILLRGRCGQCKQPISIRYPLIEVLCMCLSLFAAWHFGFNTTLVYALLFIWLLIGMSFIDIEHQLLPDGLTLGLLWLGLIANLQEIFIPLSWAVISVIIAYLTLWLLARLFTLFTGKIGMGNGDFKLFAAFGAWFGWAQLPLILIISSLSGALVGIAYLKIKNKTRDTPISFGPFLCVGGFVSLFFGNQILAWYMLLLQ